MAQQTIRNDKKDSVEQVRDGMKTTHGHERRELDVADDDHALSGMGSERQAPIESVAKNMVKRYDQKKAAIREYLANAHTAVIQRAKLVVVENGADDDTNMKDVREVLETAAKFGYEPVITVKYNQNPHARWTLKVMDNGIGIDSQTAYAIRDIGLSGWHQDGSTNGQFGIGTMSGFLLSGLHGEFHMTTKSAVSGENYQAAWKLTDLNRLNGTRDTVGTTFTWPTLCAEAQDIDIRDAVRSYSEGMIVPVIYEEYGEDGTETGNSDEFLPEYMESRYPDDAMVITYEDQFGKAVWSPEDPEGYNSNISTFCGYQPIDRNERGFSMNTYEMPTAFDFRLKVEDGSIIEVTVDDESTMDHELVGKTPVSDAKYESMLLSERRVVPESTVDDRVQGYTAPEWCETADYILIDDSRAESMSNVENIASESVERDALERVAVGGKYEGRRIVSDSEWESMDDGSVGEEFVARSDIPDDIDVLTAMKPTDDRDRFERKHVSDVLRRYSEQLWDELRSETSRVFESVDQFNDIFDLDGNEQALFHKGISRFGPQYSRSSPDTVQETLQDELGVTLSTDVCEKIDVMKKKVSLARRDTRRPHKKDSRVEKPVWKVIRKAQDDDKDGSVYMGWRITEQKARLAWELNEHNQVVQTTKRDLLSDRLGWKDLSDLPTKNFEKHFDHDFDDDFLDTWESTGSSSSSSRAMDSDITDLSYDDERAQKRDVTVRTGMGNRSSLTRINGQRLFETLDSSGDKSASFKSYDIKTLILYRQTERGKNAGSRYANKESNVFYAVVPNYVYDYLIKADDTVTEDQFLDSLTETWIDYDWTSGPRSGRTIGDADERDVFVMCGGSEDFDQFRTHDAMDDFRDTIEQKLTSKDRLDDGQSIRSITYKSDLSDYFDVLNNKGCYDLDDDESRPSIVNVNESAGYGYPFDLSVGQKTVFFDSILGDLDQSAPEWKMMDIRMEDDEMIDALQRLQDAGGFVSTDDDAELPVPDDDRLRLDKRRYGDVDLSRDQIWLTKTLERLESVGGFESDEGSDGDAQ